MKRFLRVMMCAAMVLTAIACSTKTDISVMSYNVRVDVSEDGEHRWPNRRHASLNLIRTEQPTIFGVQEALPWQYQYLADSLSAEYGSYGVGREDGVARGEYMAIFYRKDQVELLDCGTFWLSETPEVPSRGWDAMCRRTCTWTKLKMKESGKTFFYFNTHLDHVGAEARRQSLLMIAERIKEYAAADEPVFLTADFNSTVDQPIYEPIKALLIDSRMEAPESDHRATLNRWRADQKERADCVIDHIFVRGVEPQSFKMLDGDYGAPFISDHYPVLLRAQF